LPKRAFALLSLLFACEPNLVVGKYDCLGSTADGGAAENVDAVDAPVAMPWSTSFESGFCDYAAVDGYCYAAARASYQIVTTPVHSGSHAAAFSVVADTAFDGIQARCVRQGRLPSAAYYSAFFFIPSAPTAANNWNLMHFRGGDATAQHGLWDVSLAPQTDGSLRLFVFDFLHTMTRNTTAPAVPVGSWFKLEVYLQRAADTTGELAVYQDGQLALSLTSLVTDDSSDGQWYVGNLAFSLTPAESTIYVDDVSIRETP
jgi:hypothetical protein